MNFWVVIIHNTLELTYVYVLFVLKTSHNPKMVVDYFPGYSWLKFSFDVYFLISTWKSINLRNMTAETFDTKWGDAYFKNLIRVLLNSLFLETNIDKYPVVVSTSSIYTTRVWKKISQAWSTPDRFTLYFKMRYTLDDKDRNSRQDLESAIHHWVFLDFKIILKKFGTFLRFTSY